MIYTKLEYFFKNGCGHPSWRTYVLESDAQRPGDDTHKLEDGTQTGLWDTSALLVVLYIPYFGHHALAAFSAAVPGGKQ